MSVIQVTSARYTPYAIREKGTGDVLGGIFMDFQNFAQKSKNELEDLMNSINNLAQSTIEQFKKVFENISEVVKQLLEKSKEIGIDVTTCVTNQGKYLVELKNTFENQVNALKDKKVAQVQNFIQEIEAKFQQVVGKFNEYKTQLLKCATLDLVCYSIVVGDAGKYIVSNIEDIQYIKNEAVILVDIEEVKQDFQKIINTTLEMANKILTDINNCVNGLISINS